MLRGTLIPALAAAAVLAACRTPGRELAFRGNSEFSAKALRAAAVDDLRDFERHAGRKSSIDDAAYAMERLYKARGFAFATVEYELEEQGPGARPRVTILVEEGPRVSLLGVEVDGNRALSTDELRALFELEDRAPFFVQADLEAAASSIERYYASQGFLAVRVAPPLVELTPDRRGARVRIQVEEGPRYTVGELRLEGELGYDESMLRAALGFEPGVVFTARKPWEARARLLEFYGARGHADATVSIDEQRDPVSGVVDLTLSIEAGPTVRVGAVRVEGLAHARESLVRSRLALKPGDPWRRDRERSSIAALYRTGVFSGVEVGLEPGSGEERDLVVRLREGSSLSTWIEPGWGSYDLFRLAAGVTERNFLGTARTVEAEMLASVRTQSARLALIDPWLFGSEYSADLTLSARRREEPSFTRTELGVGTGLKRSWSAHFSSTLAYQYRISDAIDTDVSVDSQSVNISQITLGSTYDRRDNVLISTHGDVSKATLELSSRLIGSELDFLRPRLSRADYFPLTKDLVLASSARTGLILPTAGDEIPIQERFFNGGENTVRSFRENELGPRDAQNKPLGGESSITLNLELRRRFGRTLELAGFLDAGNVGERWEDYFDFEGFRSGIGAGLRYYLPIGPLRLDLASNPDPRLGEDRWVLHFSVGAAF